MERIELCRQVNVAAQDREWVGSRLLNKPRRSMLAGLRAAPLADFESLIPPLPAWTGPRLVELSDERARSVAESGVRVLGDPDLLRYEPDADAPELGEPPVVLPADAAAAAIENALAGIIERPGRARRRRAPKPAPAPDPLAGISGRALVRELAHRQAARLRSAVRPRKEGR
ncbi:MAG: hypothetical protein QM747_20640 [Nocardioides sp.]